MNREETQWLHALYHTYAQTLYRLARARLGDPHGAQDLVQSVFLAAAQKADALRAHENPLGWLLRALNYELSHAFARDARRKARETPLDNLPPGQAQSPPPSLGLERGWQQLTRARRRQTWGRPRQWIAAAGVALAVALPAGHLLAEAPAEAPAAAWSLADYAPLYRFLGTHTLVAFDPLPRAELPNQGVLFQEPARLPTDAQIQDGPYRPQEPEDGITEFYVEPPPENP